MPESMARPPELPRDWGAVRPRLALLINPFYPKSPHGSFGKHVLTPTLALSSIAGVTPSHWQVRCWDENLLQGPPPSDPLPEVVGITVHLTFAQRACELARWYRNRGVKVILGGLHAQSCPGELEPHADAIAIGNGSVLWPRILQDVEQGTLKPRYEAGYSSPYREEPPPARSLMPRESFLTTASVIATRGCRNRCGFCHLSTHGLQMPCQHRDIEDVRRQIESDDQPYAVFTDNNLGADPAYLRALCRSLRHSDRIWSAAVTLDVTDDPSLVRDMALAGCVGVFIGFESLTAENLAGAGKRSVRPEDYAWRIRVFHDHGIQVNGSFVLGFDGDGKDCFEHLAGWIEAQRMTCATFHILTPYPGTPLFRQLQSEGRLLHKNWNLYDTAHCVFRPRRMTPEELELGYDWIYRRIFSHASIWRRRPVGWTSIPAYLAGAYFYKRSNRLWHFLIRHRLVHAAWRPLIEFTRFRHAAFRRRLESQEAMMMPGAARSPVPASV